MIGVIEWVLFLALAAVAVLTALLYVLTMSMYRAAVTVMASFAAVAGLMVMLDADMLAAMVMMMGIGSMLLMILFMLMEMPMPGGEMMWKEKKRMRIPGLGAMTYHLLSQAPPDAPGHDTDHGQHEVPDKEWDELSARERWDLMWQMGMQTNQLRWAIGLGSAVAVLAIAIVAMTPWPIAETGPTREAEAAVGELLLSRYMIGMEAAAFLILSGMIGAVILARRERERRDPDESGSEGGPS